MARAQRGAVDAQRGGNTGAQVVDEDVCVSRQAFESGLTLGAFQVQRHRLLAPVEDLKIERIPVPKRRAHLACIIAAFDTFELDYLSAQVGEDRSGKRACQHLAQFQHTHTVQHARHIEPLRYLFDGTPV